MEAENTKECTKNTNKTDDVQRKTNRIQVVVVVVDEKIKFDSLLLHLALPRNVKGREIATLCTDPS